MRMRMLNRATETLNRNRIRNRIRIPTHSTIGPWGVVRKIPVLLFCILGYSTNRSNKRDFVE